MTSKQKIVISLGGSLVVPKEVDFSFVESFRSLIQDEIKKEKEFIVIVGGGKTARLYQEAAKKLGVISAEDLDWVGIFATRLNAELARVAFGELAHREIITDPTALLKVSSPVVIGAGWKPGWSTDLDAVEMAKTVGAKQLVNLSNINYVYDKDPKVFPDAKKMEKISWNEFRKIIPEKWSPGVNSPFDPVAAKLADKLGLEVVIMNGNPIDNLRNYFEGKKFRGTVISN